MRAELTIPEAVIEAQPQVGHVVEREPYNGRGYQGILIDPRTGVLQGESEVRKDGCAAGY